MELTQWNVQEFRLEQGENVAFILYRPLTQSWRNRHLEVSLNLQRAFAASGVTNAQLLEEGGVPEEEIPGIVSNQSEAFEMFARYQDEMVSSLVVGSRALTIGGEEPDVKSLVTTILEMEDLKMDLCAHILKEGAVTQDEGKD